MNLYPALTKKVRKKEEKRGNESICEVMKKKRKTAKGRVLESPVCGKGETANKWHGLQQIREMRAK